MPAFCHGRTFSLDGIRIGKDFSIVYLLLVAASDSCNFSRISMGLTKTWVEMALIREHLL